MEQKQENESGTNVMVFLVFSFIKLQALLIGIMAASFII